MRTSACGIRVPTCDEAGRTRLGWPERLQATLLSALKTDPGRARGAVGLPAAGPAALGEEAAGHPQRPQQRAGAGALHAAAGPARVRQEHAAQAARRQAAAPRGPGRARPVTSRRVCGAPARRALLPSSARILALAWRYGPESACGQLSGDTLSYSIGLRRTVTPGPRAQVCRRVSYNGRGLSEFIPERTAVYVTQEDQHMPELTVRETLDFSARCQGTGSHAGQ